MDASGDDSKSAGTDTAAITVSEARVAEMHDEKKESELDKLPMNERRHFLIKVRMMLRRFFRDLFGVSFSNRWGHWLDRHMTHLVSEFGYWLDYPKGHHVLRGYIDAVFAAAVSTDGRFLFTAGLDGRIIIWDLLDHSKLKQFVGSEKGIHSLNYECDLLVFGGKDTKIRILNGITHDLIRTLEGHSDSVYSVQFNKECTQILSASADRSVKIWCIKTGDCLVTLTGHTNSVRSAYFMDNNTRVISSSLDRSIKLWSMTDKNECDTITEGIKDNIYNMCVNCDSSLVACFFDLSGLTIYNWPKMDIVRSMEVNALTGQFHPSNPDVLAVEDPMSNSINIYNVRSGDTIVEWKDHTDEVNELCWSRDGYRLVSAGQDRTSRLWDFTPWME